MAEVMWPDTIPQPCPLLYATPYGFVVDETLAIAVLVKRFGMRQFPF